MSGEKTGEAMASHYGLDDVPFISDPEKRLYKAFGLARGSMRQLFGIGVWVRGVRAAILDGHGAGKPDGDPRQMPGTFLVYRRRVVRSYVHENAADRPDYVAMSRMPVEKDAG